MPRMENNGGDALARGCVSATFKPAGSKLSEEQWNKIWDEEAAAVRKAVYIFNCPAHGTYHSDREFFISGGYPLMNEYAVGVCPRSDCGEKTTFSGFRPIDEDGTVEADFVEEYPYDDSNLPF